MVIGPAGAEATHPQAGGKHTQPPASPLPSQKEPLQTTRSVLSHGSPSPYSFVLPKNTPNPFSGPAAVLRNA